LFHYPLGKRKTASLVVRDPLSCSITAVIKISSLALLMKAFSDFYLLKKRLRETLNNFSVKWEKAIFFIHVPKTGDGQQISVIVHVHFLAVSWPFRIPKTVLVMSGEIFLRMQLEKQSF